MNVKQVVREPVGGFEYLCYGLPLRSQQALPGLTQCSLEAGVSPFVLTFESGRERMADMDGAGVTIAEDLSRLAFRYPPGIEFDVDVAGRDMTCRLAEGHVVDEAAVFLAGPVLGLLLRVLGTLVLHASAVLVGDGAVAFVGASGAGKSSLAARLSRSDCAVVCDDVLAVDVQGRRGYARAGFPALRLRPDAARHLYGDVDALPRFVDGWDRRCLALDVARRLPAGETRRIDAVYILEPRDGDVAIEITTLGSTQTFAALSAHSYRSDLLGRRLREQEFASISALCAETPIRFLRYPHRLSSLEELAEAVMHDVARMQHVHG